MNFYVKLVKSSTDLISVQCISVVPAFAVVLVSLLFFPYPRSWSNTFFQLFLLIWIGLVSYFVLYKINKKIYLS